THSVGLSGLIANPRKPGRNTDEWARFAAQDLNSSFDEHSLRKFLWHFGPDSSDGRAYFRPLTEVRLSIESSPTNAAGEAALSAIGFFFAQQDDALRLKAELFGQRGRYRPQLGSETELLGLLISH